VGDDSIRTEVFSHCRFLTPVESSHELAETGAQSGFLCLVTSENAIYELHEGKWRKWVSEDGPLVEDNG
jgi:hypothetical protein